MAEQGGYSYGGGESNKRKADDYSSPATGMAKGFSSPPSYTNVPPPLNDFELAKRKAQEIAARLLNSVDPTKRARVENGSSDGGFDSSEYGSHRSLGFSSSAPPQASFTSYSTSSKKIEIPNGKVGVIIGKGGETIKYLQLQSGAKIQVTRDMDADPNSVTRDVELMGTADQIAKAEQLINDVLSEAEAGASNVGSRRIGGPPSDSDQFVMKIPNNKVGLVIGKGGETIKNMQSSTGARIQVIPLHLPQGDMSRERTVQIDGTPEQIEAAKQLVEEVISENRGRNSSMSGGYSQQGYQAGPPPNWGQHGPPMPQPGYGYVQPGPYSVPPPQYNMNQAPYSGYAPPPNTGGYSSGWDQSHNQQAAHGSYDYYNQQPPPPPTHGGPGGSSDGSGYNYGQVPPYGQGHGQDGYGYGTSQQGYGPPSSGSGYDQQQYSSYGAPSNQSSDGNTSYGAQDETRQVPPPGQTYNAGAQPPATTPSYPAQTSTQPSYGTLPPSSQGGHGTQPPSGYGNYEPPQPQKPPGTQPPPYGQSQQSPSAPSGYSQGSYPQSQVPPAPPQPQPSHAQSQTDPNAQWAPPSSSDYQPSSYNTGPLMYGHHPSYQYSSAYGGGYPQASAYPSDTSAGGNGNSGSAVTPPPQSSQPPSATTSAKSSPPS